LTRFKVTYFNPLFFQKNLSNKIPANSHVLKKTVFKS
jgi:hypothetical protein